MGISKQVYGDAPQWVIDIAKKDRATKRAMIVDWFFRNGWISAEEKLFMNMMDSMEAYNREYFKQWQK